MTKTRSILKIDTTEERVYSQAQRALRSSNLRSPLNNRNCWRLASFWPFCRASTTGVDLRPLLEPGHGKCPGHADRFIRLYPNHPNVDYAHTESTSAYRFREGLLDRLFSSDPASRDMAPLRESYSELAVLLNEFPNSQYAADARQRMLQLRELLAKAELLAADYYLRRGALVAAANRGTYLIENYPDTEARADALAVMVEAFYKLGREDEANRSPRVLALNHPDYPDPMPQEPFWKSACAIAIVLDQHYDPGTDGSPGNPPPSPSFIRTTPNGLTNSRAPNPTRRTR